MKIGLVCPYNVFSRPGGVLSYVNTIHAELKKRGHEVRIITPAPKEIPDEYDPDILLLARSRALTTPFRTTSDISYDVDSDEIDQTLARENFDVLHFHEPWIPRLPMQILARSHCANIATFHGKLPDGRLNKGFEKVITPYTKQVFKNLDYLTAVSDSAASYVRSLTNGTPIEIIPNSVNLSYYNPAKVAYLPQYHQDDIKTIFCVGRLEGRKGVIWLLKAYEELIQTHPNVRLLIAGDGPKRTMLEDYVDMHHLPNVEFLGFISEEEKLQYLKTTDIFCSPALYGESFGIVLIEAMAMGAVTVCGNNEGYEGVMKERGRISLINPKATEEFAERLELLLFDDQIRNLWRKWAKEYVKQFDSSVIVDRYEEIYEQVVAQER
ncbi:MAG TPA: glycosyltransferase family 4 protein [Candidatus Saccharimonadales bacterium]|nr:glycosyltransferase family 4 protein [Candidatus Saccharimonadales bacterium]